MTAQAPQPFLATGEELELFEAAARSGLPVMVLGPTGCGKTRMVEHMAGVLDRPLVTVACHDDLTSADLVGRYLVQGGDVTWIDGPLTRAARDGAVCYLDEVIEARRDTLAVLHSLADHRRTLHLERANEVVAAAAGFTLVCSYNPRHRGAFKELLPSLRQRFVTLEITYLPPEHEATVVAAETGVDRATAEALVQHAVVLREAGGADAKEEPSTRLLINAARLMCAGRSLASAVEVAVLRPLLDTGGAELAVRELLRASGLG